MKNILVTGCDGDIGYSLGKIIRLEHVADKLVGCSICVDSASVRYFEPIEKISPVSAESYIDELQNLVKKHNINLVIPASETELRFFIDNNIRYIDSIPILMVNALAAKVGFDKYKTYNFLGKIKLPRPWTVLGNETPLEYPCILKARAGSGCKSVVVIDDAVTLNRYKERCVDKFIFQEMLLPDTEEYTCGVYRSLSKEIHTIIFRRKLRINDGCTVQGELCFHREIESLLKKLADELNLYGSINVQLRVTSDGPRIFEINPRFSSTVVFRHLLGFKDLIWSIQEQFAEIPETYRLKSDVAKFYKVYDEFFCEMMHL